MLVSQVILLTICAAAKVKAQSYVMPPADADLHIYALPVGQGDATVIQCPAGTGHLTIVDFGSSTRHSALEGITYMTNAEITNFIGANTVDYVYLTHGDLDHYNLIPRLGLLPNSVTSVLIGCEENNYGCLTPWLQQVDALGNLIKFPDSPGCTTTCGHMIQICNVGVYMRVMGANLDNYSQKDCTNGYSMITRLEYNNFKLLFPGDAEDYGPWKYDDDGYITSNIGNWTGQPGLLRKLINAWATTPGGIQADFFRLAHHGTFPHGNKEFFLNAVAPQYVFSSSQLPGTKGTHGHPSCMLYDILTNGTIPTIATVTGPTQQEEYSCGVKKNRETEHNNTYGVYTTAVCDGAFNFHNYIIKIDTDGTNHGIGPVELAPSSMGC